jgi:hypothetical protein
VVTRLVRWINDLDLVDCDWLRIRVANVEDKFPFTPMSKGRSWVVAAAILSAPLMLLTLCPAVGDAVRILFMLCYADMFVFPVGVLDSRGDAVFPTNGHSMTPHITCWLNRTICKSNATLISKG